MFLMSRLHLTRSCASSPDHSFSDKCFLMLSNHFRFDLPLLLFPGTSITITLLPTYSSSHLNTCPYHFNLLSCTFLDISLLILPSLVTPLIHLNILISATPNLVTAYSNCCSPRTVERYNPSHPLERLSSSLKS